MSHFFFMATLCLLSEEKKNHHSTTYIYDSSILLQPLFTTNIFRNFLSSQTLLKNVINFLKVSNKHKPFCGRLRHRRTGRPNRVAETLSTARPAPRTPAPAGPTGPRALSPPLPTLNSQKKKRIQDLGEI